MEQPQGRRAERRFLTSFWFSEAETNCLEGGVLLILTAPTSKFHPPADIPPTLPVFLPPPSPLKGVKGVKPEIETRTVRTEQAAPRRITAANLWLTPAMG